MERIKERSMIIFVLSSLLNLGIGLVFGFLVGIILTIATGAAAIGVTLFTLPIIIGLIVALLASNMYRMYFYYRLSLDVNEVCKGDGQESESYVISFVLSTLTFGLYHIYWIYKLAQRMRANAPRYGFKMLETGKDIAVLDAFSFGFISAWELIKNMNRMAKVYNQSGVPEVVGGVQ